MKRAILFRGKTITGEWVYGYYEFDEHLQTGLIRNGKGFVSEVVSDTIGEYSAKLDIHKKRICEGDIVSLWPKQYPTIKSDYEVLFDGNEFTLIHAKREGDKYGVYTHRFNLYGDEYKVIGNIHDNPELSK